MTTITPAQQKALNAFVYFTERISRLTLSKAIQLLYLADEYAVRKSGAPITWLDYHVWKSGPVPEDLYNKIMQATNPEQKLTAIAEAPLFIKNIKSSSKQLDSVLVSVKPFDDSRFSDFEILVLQDIITSYGHYTDSKLLDILHEIDTLWHRMVSANHLGEQFRLKGNRSAFVIDFSMLSDTDYKKAAFHVAYQSYLMEISLL